MIPLDLDPQLLADLDAYALDRHIGRTDAIAELLAAALAPTPNGLHVPSRWDPLVVTSMEYRATGEELLRQVRLLDRQHVPDWVLRQVGVNARRGAHDGRGVDAWTRGR